MERKRIAILGSTGSIGTSALDVVAALPGDFRVSALSAQGNVDLLAAQAARFRPELVCIGDEKHYARLRRRVPGRTRVVCGSQGLEQVCAGRDVDHVLVAISAAAALDPLLTSIRHRKEVSLANKESLVMAGDLVMQECRRQGVVLRPIDSEQSAIWQCLLGRGRTAARRIYLTASGGPFRGKTAGQLRRISVKQALHHPRWKMGRKVSVDSATLMNKGLEVIEAMHLFGMPSSAIEVLVHPQSIVHSMVEFEDATVIAQLSVADMRVPIQYALSYPRTLKACCPAVDFPRIASLTFEKPDLKNFPALRLAFEAARAGGTLPAVLAAADEVCVQAFLDGRIGFLAIVSIVENVMRRHRIVQRPSLSAVYAADAWAREQAGIFTDRKKYAR